MRVIVAFRAFAEGAGSSLLDFIGPRKKDGKHLKGQEGQVETFFKGEHIGESKKGCIDIVNTGGAEGSLSLPPSRSAPYCHDNAKTKAKPYVLVAEHVGLSPKPCYGVANGRCKPSIS